MNEAETIDAKFGALLQAFREEFRNAAAQRREHAEELRTELRGLREDFRKAAVQQREDADEHFGRLLRRVSAFGPAEASPGVPRQVDLEQLHFGGGMLGERTVYWPFLREQR